MDYFRVCNNYEGFYDDTSSTAKPRIDLFKEENRYLRKDRVILQPNRDLCLYVWDQYDTDRSATELEKYKEKIYNLTLDKRENEIEQIKINFQHRLQQEQQQNQREIRRLENSFNDILASNQAKINGQERELQILNFNLKDQKETLEATKSINREMLNQSQQERHKMFKLQSQLDESQQLLNYSKQDVERRDMKIRILKEKVDDIEKDNNHRYRISLNKRTDQSYRERDQLRQALREKENELSNIKSERNREICTRKEIERKLEAKERTIRILEDENSQNISSYKYKILQMENELRDSNLRSKARCPSVKYEYRQEGKHTNEQIVTKLELKICHLELELAKRDQCLKDLKENSDNKNLESVKERDFIAELQKTERKLSEQNYQLQKAESKLKDTRTKLDEATFEMESVQQTKETLERKTKENEIRIKEKYENTERSHKQRIQNLQTEVECRDIQLKGFKEILDKRNVEATCRTEVTTNLKKQNEQLAEQKDRLQQALTKLKESEAKLNEAVSERDLERTSKQELERKMKACHGRIKELEQINDKQVTQQNERIQALQRDVDSRDLKLKDFEKTLDNRNVGLTKEKVVTTDLEKRDAQLSETRHQLHLAQTRLKESESKLGRAISERDFERTTREQVEMKKREDRSTVKKLEEEHNRIVTPLKQRIQYLEGEVERRDLELKGLKEALDSRKVESGRVNGLMKELKDKEDLLSEQRNQLQRALTKLKETECKLKETTSERDDDALREEKQLEKLKDQLNQTSVKLKETEAELEETKTRLSKAMGDKLTDNNPNIADLSDKNRPVKLAERYAELYDNQWTDAFDVVGKYFDREQQTIEALLAMLQDVMVFCNESGSKQMKDLQSVLGFSNIHRGVVSADVRKNLKDCRKAASSVAIENLYETYMSQLKRSTSQILVRALEVRPYVKESLEICWLMVIQDPPVVFAPVAKRGSELNTDVFKPYTSSGTHVEYTVWPALLLHEGGPVLAKGVAQGYGKKSK